MEDDKVPGGKPLNTMALALGYAALLLGGGVVVFGWHAELPMLVQIHPSFVPMQYNTALGFLFYGAGFLSLIKGSGRYTVGFNAVAFTIGGLTLLEYILNVNLGIDELFMTHGIDIKSSHPGRMAPNTALCFTLASLSNIVMNMSIRRGTVNMTGGLLAALVAALGAVALMGYISDIETAYGWGNLTRMALHTSVGFVMLGAGGLIFAWQKEASHESPFTSWAPYVAGLLVLTIVVSLWQALRAQLSNVGGSSDHHVGIIADDLMLTFGVLLAVAFAIIIHHTRELHKRAVQAERIEDEFSLNQRRLQQAAKLTQVGY